MGEPNATSFAAEGAPNASTGRNASAGAVRAQVPALLWVIVSVSPLGFLGNGLLLWFLCFRMRRSPFTVYIAHLCLADTSLLLCVSALTALTAGRGLSSGDAYAPLTLSVTFLFGYNAGLYLLTAISVERCLSVLYPIWFRCRRPEHQSALVCALLWALSCVVTAVEYALCADSGGRSSPRGRCRPVLVLVAVLSFLVFTPLMVGSSAVLVARIRRSAWASHASKPYLVIAATVAAFLALATPVRLLCLLYYGDWRGGAGLDDVSVLCSVLNSSANPCIYFFVGSSRERRFRESLKVALTRPFKDETQPRRQAGSGGPAAEMVV